MTDPRRNVARWPDRGLGAVLLLVGAIAGNEARSFDELSRSFPLVTAALLALCGVWLLIRPTLRPWASVGLGSIAGTLLAIVGWSIAFAAGLGVFAPTIVLQLVLLTLLGVRPMFKVALLAFAISTIIYAVFVELLDVPLPDTYAYVTVPFSG